MAIDKPCPTCKGSLHVRSGRAWKRCPDCSRKLLGMYYIKPHIRQGEEELPSEWKNKLPGPLVDTLILGNYNPFRYMVWNSLLFYEQRDLTYDYMDAYRLVEIFLSQDTTYSRIRDLEVLDLVVIILGVADAPNRQLPNLLTQLVTQRKIVDHPTWVFTPLTVSRLRNVYGNELADLLGSFVQVNLIGQSATKSSESQILT